MIRNTPSIKINESRQKYSAHKIMTTHLIPLKQWRAEQAVVNGVSLHAIEMRWLRGKYPEVKATLVTKNHKVKFVRQTANDKENP